MGGCEVKGKCVRHAGERVYARAKGRKLSARIVAAAVSLTMTSRINWTLGRGREGHGIVGDAG